MVAWILAVLISIPIIEIALFIKIGGLIGVLPTVAIMVLAGVGGLSLLRIQGLATLFKAQESLRQGRFPVDEVFDGLCLMAAGGLLVIPGFFTDVLALFLFIPAIRRLLRTAVARRLVASGKVHVYGAGPGGLHAEGSRSRPDDPRVIEGEFEDLTERPQDDDEPQSRIGRR